MKYIILLCAILLSACSTVAPVKQKFPEAPDVLLKGCPDLDTIDQPKVLLSELMKTVTNNYTKYHDCRNLNDAWKKWYDEQKKIFEDANSKK